MSEKASSPQVNLEYAELRETMEKIWMGKLKENGSTSGRDSATSE